MSMGISGKTAFTFLRSQMTPLIALIIILLGTFAVLVTPKEEEPQINVTMANIFVPFAGASAQDVENMVSTPAEQVLSQITGIEHVYSVSRPGMAILTVQYKVGEDRTQSLVKLYDTIFSRKDWISPNLGVGEPIIKPMGIDDVPIVSFTLWSKNQEKAGFELERIAHSLEIELKKINGTREVSTIGGPGHVVRVVMDAERMNAHQVSAQDIKNALQLSNSSQPSGYLTENNQQILVQTGAYLQNTQDVKNLIVGVLTGTPVYMTDVAKIEDGPNLPSNQYVWIGGKSIAQGETPATTITVTKKSGENAVEIANKAIARMNQLKNTLIPADVDFTITRNYGETADEKAKKLISKLIFATGSVILLVAFTLGKREAVIVGVAVGLTLSATLFASWVWGFTLNRVSLFALIFSIGILVDDAIVVVENIHRRMHIDKKPLIEIIPNAVDEVGSPTILATFTVIAALLPMAFVSGLMGPYMSPIPINSSLGMVISLAIAFIITPWLSSKWLKDENAHVATDGSLNLNKSTDHHTQDDKLHTLFDRILSPFLNKDNGRKNRFGLLFGILFLIFASVSLAYFKLVVLKMLPFDNKSEFQIVVDMPVGTPVEQTATVLHDIGSYLQTVKEVDNYQAYAGTASPINFNGLVRQYYLRKNNEMGDIQVNLLHKDQRHEKSHEIAQRLRPEIEKIAKKYNANVKVVEVPPGPPVMSPIVAEIYGPDYDGQMKIAKQVAGHFGKTADIIGIDDSIEEDSQRYVLRVLQNKSALKGVAQKDIVETMNLGLSGLNVTPIHSGQNKYELPVRITLASEKQNNLDELLKLTVRSRDNQLIPLSELIEVVPNQREKTIYHKDLLPVVYVFADSAGKLDSPLYGLFDIYSKINEHMPDLKQYFVSQPENRYESYALKWDGESQITYETFRDMGIAYGVGLILIYLLVVAEFKSYSVPLIIMIPIPLTIIGVMPGHALLGSQFTATSMIGMIALAGIIVRNSILLVDFINQQVKEGIKFQEAVILAGSTRAKPIVLTGVAAMMGALFILDDPIFNGLAISLLFGILISTMLTLVVIPVLYYATFYKKHD